MLKVASIPILTDNYVHVPFSEDSRQCVVVDPGEAAPVRQYLQASQLKPLAILLTHHHNDHIGGAAELRDLWQVPIYAPAKEKSSIPFASFYLQEGDIFKPGPFRFQIMELPGHTLGHIAYWEKNQKWLFSGDVLFSMGCGRVFEGTMLQHYQSLHRLKLLPPETMIYCTHEYTEKNCQFCLQIEPQNQELQAFAAQVHQLRLRRQPTVPFPLEQELRLNPFLRATSAREFQVLREARNRF